MADAIRCAFFHIIGNSTLGGQVPFQTPPSRLQKIGGLYHVELIYSWGYYFFRWSITKQLSLDFLASFFSSAAVSATFP